MPTKVEKDSITGTETTGHEWDGIKELNTPLPRWWLYVFYATVAYSLVYFVLYPTVPGFDGILDTTNRMALEDKLATAQERQAVYRDRIAVQTSDQIAADAELLSFALAGGRSLFADNCAPCHGLGGAGQHGYPALADDVWIWGGTMDDIETSILYGIRSEHEDTRYSEMPAFGADEILSAEEIAATADFVLSLSGRTGDEAGDEAANEAAAQAGAEIYADNCAACHGEAGEGDTSQGAPRLNDQIWLYGGERDEIIAQIGKPQHGEMPPWVGRLDPDSIKMLTVYIHSLGGGQP